MAASEYFNNVFVIEHVFAEGFVLFLEEHIFLLQARESLEKLLSNVKYNNASLEEKLQSETLNRTQREREVEEHKGLWESEVKSRSKLGVKVSCKFQFIVSLSALFQSLCIFVVKKLLHLLKSTEEIFSWSFCKLIF